MSTECLFPQFPVCPPLSLPPHPHDAHPNSLLYNPQRCTSVQLVCTFKYLLPGLKIDFGGQTKQGKRQVGGSLTRPTSGRSHWQSDLMSAIFVPFYSFRNIYRRMLDRQDEDCLKIPVTSGENVIWSVPLALLYFSQNICWNTKEGVGCGHHSRGPYYFQKLIFL